MIFAPNFDEHLSRLTTVLTCLKNANLTLNHKKCRFGENELKVLGHVVSSDGVKPDPAKLHAIMHFPIPRNARDLQRFLGLASYYRRFISGFSHICHPLNSLLSKHVPFVWTSDVQFAFDTLRK